MAQALHYGFPVRRTGGFTLIELMLAVAILGVLEISLSFDNAVINATVLERMSDFWQKIFLTIGIVIAVFGMRLLLPLVIVWAARLAPSCSCASAGRAVTTASTRSSPRCPGSSPSGPSRVCG